MKRKVVVTGVGAVTGYGIGADALWKGLIAGRSSVRPVEWVGWDSENEETVERTLRRWQRRGVRTVLVVRSTGGTAKAEVWAQ